MNTTALTRALLAKVKDAPWMPRFRTGEIVDVDPTPMVTLAGDTDPIPANSLGDPGGVGETVWAVQFGNTCLVIGRAGGTRYLGSAFATSDDTFTSAEVLDTLTVDVVVTQPGRTLRIDGQAMCSVDTNNGIVILRITQDGVNVQRIGQHRFPASAQSEYMGGFALVSDLDPGGYTFAVTGEASGATGTFQGATSRGQIIVTDVGPVLA